MGAVEMSISRIRVRSCTTSFRCNRFL